MIDIIDSERVAPDTSSKLQELTLSPLDTGVYPVIPIVVLFIYSPQPGSSSLIPIEKLRKALQSTLSYYPHLAGKLHLDPTNISDRSIRHLDHGAELISASCSLPLSSFRKRDQTFTVNDLPDKGNALWPKFEPTLKFTQDTSVLAIQHTRFLCGSVILGIRILHTVVDAEGFFNFTRDLAEIYRKISKGEEGILDIIPTVKPFVPTRKVEEKFEPQFMYVGKQQEGKRGEPLPEGPPAPTPQDEPSATSVPTKVTGRFFQITTPHIQQLKSQNPDDSTYANLSAFLYRQIYLARQKVYKRYGKEMSSPDFLTPVNIRSRLKNTEYDLGEKYTGNALLCVTGTLPLPTISSTSSNLRMGNLKEIAAKISSLTHHPSMKDPSHLSSTIDWLNSVDTSKTRQKDFVASESSIMISAWNKIEEYKSMKFECEPIMVQNPFTPIHLVDGLGYLLPPSPEEREVNGIEVVLALALMDEVWAELDFSINAI